MHIRLLKKLQAVLPDVDMDDFEALQDSTVPARQFAAEYSQDCYTEMMENENKAFGNYLVPNNHFNVTTEERDAVISTIQTLHKKKDGYKPETMHLAGNITDRYLHHLAINGKHAPNLAMLATISILMAAKLEQPVSPSFNRMINLLPESQRKRMDKEDLVDLEEKIILALDFDFNYASPITFLERYQRLFSVDQEAEDKNMQQIGHTARQFCKYMQRNSNFLEYTQAQ
jgi:hypothetical protein